MLRLAALALLASSAACGGSDTCGELTLELADNASAYPPRADIGCDVPTGGIWDKTKNDAAFVLTSPDLPADVYIVANMPISMIAPGATLSVPVGVSGEAYTGTQQNHANLTAGTIVIAKDLGVDTKVKARVFQLQWDLTWLGTGTYRSHGDAAVWFTGVNGQL